MSLNMFARSPFPLTMGFGNGGRPPGLRIRGMGGAVPNNIYGTVATDVTGIGNILYQGLTGQDANVTAVLEQAGTTALGDITGGIGGTTPTPTTPQQSTAPTTASGGALGSLGGVGILALAAAAFFLLKKR